MPWKAERKVVEETLNKRPGTEYIDMLFLGKYYGYGDKLPSPKKGRLQVISKLHGKMKTASPILERLSLL